MDDFDLTDNFEVHTHHSADYTDENIETFEDDDNTTLDNDGTDNTDIPTEYLSDVDINSTERDHYDIWDEDNERGDETVDNTDMQDIGPSERDHCNIWDEDRKQGEETSDSAEIFKEPTLESFDISSLFGTYEADEFEGFDDFTEVHGTPLEEMRYWNEQESPMSCAVATSSMMFNSLGINVDEDTLATIYQYQGIYDPSGGTNPDLISDSINRIANVDGLNIKASEINNFSVNDLKETLDSGSKVLVALDGAELYGDADITMNELANIPDMGHAIELTGWVDTPEGEFAVINDPGVPDGAGQMIPMAKFMDAAQDFDFKAVTIART